MYGGKREIYSGFLLEQLPIARILLPERGILVEHLPQPPVRLRRVRRPLSVDRVNRPVFSALEVRRKVLTLLLLVFQNIYLLSYLM